MPAYSEGAAGSSRVLPERARVVDMPWQGWSAQRVRALVMFALAVAGMVGCSSQNSYVKSLVASRQCPEDRVTVEEVQGGSDGHHYITHACNSVGVFICRGIGSITTCKEDTDAEAQMNARASQQEAARQEASGASAHRPPPPPEMTREERMACAVACQQSLTMCSESCGNNVASGEDRDCRSRCVDAARACAPRCLE